MKIAHLINITQLSGASVMSIEILKGLPADKYEKYIVTGLDVDGYEEFMNVCDRHNIKVIVVESARRAIGLSDFSYLFELIKIFRTNRFDIVHTNSSKPGLIGRIAAKIAKTRVIIHTVHGIAFHRDQNFIKRGIVYILDLLGTPFCDYQVLVNQFYHKYYSWLPWVRSITIKNGSSISDENLALVNEYSKQKSDAKTVLYLARLENQKNPLALLSAIKLLKESNPRAVDNTVFRFVGDGDLRPKCEEFVKLQNLNDLVVFAGWSQQKWKEIALCDFLCVPSKFEACGLVFIEAALCGKPSISTFTEGVPEVILQNETGLLSEVGNIDELAKNIACLLAEPDRRFNLGLNAKRHVMKNYDIKDSISHYSKLYAQLETKKNLI